VVGTPPKNVRSPYTQEDDDPPAVRALLVTLVAGLGPSRVSMAVVCEKRDTSWLKDELLGSFPVTVTVLCRRGESLTLLRRVRRAPTGARRAR
jgi:hypothetical protein